MKYRTDAIERHADPGTPALTHLGATSNQQFDQFPLVGADAQAEAAGLRQLLQGALGAPVATEMLDHRPGGLERMLAT